MGDYVKRKWVDGEVITAEKLNNLEEGVGNLMTGATTWDKVSDLIMGDTPLAESEDYPGCYYRTVDGVTEWINPPLVLDHKEYRTTERYNNKPVYAKAISFGSLPSENIKTKNHGIPNVEDIVSVVCSATNGSGSAVYIPSASGNLYVNESPYLVGLTWASGATETWVAILTNADRTAWTGKFVVKCTKTTD